MKFFKKPQQDLTIRRLGDSVEIAGDYQFNALHTGPGFQRAWHREKLYLLDTWYSPEIGVSGLDVGFGSGVSSAHLADKGCSMTGIDSNKDAVDFATATYQTKDCSFFLGQGDEFHFEQDFDFAICLEVIEHLYSSQIQLLMNSIHNNLRSGGHLLLTTPNYRGTWPLIEKTCDSFASLPQMDGEQHVTHFYRSRLKRTLVESGFENIKISTFCTVSPVIGAVSPKSHRSFAKLEQRISLPFGNLLFCTATKP